MAVERQKEFHLDLGDLVKTQLDSFVKSRARVHAVEEASFQRSIVDNDLSYQEQLDYRQAQLEKEQEKTYPDIKFTDEVKTSVSGLKKMVRYRKFRDEYFTFLQDMASGRKSLEDHIQYLQDAVEGTLDTEIKDELKDQLTTAIGAKRLQDRRIIDSQVEFNRKDRTSKSINDAIDLVKTQLAKPDIIKDETLRTSYEQQLRTLEKEKTEIGVEDKMSWMVISSVSKERKNPSLWRLEIFGGFRDKGGIDNPVNIGKVKYASEQEYWQTTLTDYIQNDFANEYIQENKNEATLIYNKTGLLPDTYLKNLIANNNILKTKVELQDFEQAITFAIQGSIVNALSFKTKDIKNKYYIGTDLATQGDYEKAKVELGNIQMLVGEDFSLSPEFQNLETQLITKKWEITGDILSRAREYATEEGISIEEAIKKIGPAAEVEIPAETYIKKEPIEIAEEVVETGKKVPELYKKREELKTKVEETKKKVEEAKKVKVEPTVEKVEKPKEGPEIHIVKSGETLWGISQKYLGSGAKWKELGYTGDPRKLQIGQKLTIPQK